MSAPTLHDILHILRNPYGWSQEAIRAAQLKACDLLESAAAPVPDKEKLMNVPMYGPVTTADRLDRLLDQQGEALSQFMREAATDAVYHLRAQHRKLLESDAIAPDQIITAQHDETGRLWTGPRSKLPRRFAEVAAPVPAREPPASTPHAAAEPEKPDGWQKHLAQSDDVDADGLIRSLRELRDTRMDALEVDERKKITQAADELTMHRRASAEAEPVAWIWHGMEGRGTKTLRWRKTNTWEYAPEGETPLYASPSAQPIAEHTKRWNIEESDNEVRICRGFHQSGEQCEWEYFVPKATV